MRLLLGQDPFVADWVAQRIPHVGIGAAFGPCSAIGVVNDDGRLVGGVVYNNWLPQYRGIELSFATDATVEIADRETKDRTRRVSAHRWLTRPIICGLLSYPFDQLDCQRVTGLTPRKATSARRFLDHFGFKREGLVRLGFGDDDAVVSGLLRSEWQASRWVKPLPERRNAVAGRVEDRQEFTQAPAGA